MLGCYICNKLMHFGCETVPKRHRFGCEVMRFVTNVTPGKCELDQSGAVAGECFGQSVNEALRHECVADRDFGDAGYVRQEVGEIELREVVAGVDAEAGGLGAAGGVGETRNGGGEGASVAEIEGFGVGASVELDAVGATGAGEHKIGSFSVGENRDSRAKFGERGDNVAQRGLIGDEIETVVRGDLTVGVGDQRHLSGGRRSAESEETRVVAAGGRERIALDVELDAGAVAQGGELVDVRGADVALVGARVHRDPVGAGGETAAREVERRGQRTTAGVAEDGDFVDVDAELSAGG